MTTVHLLASSSTVDVAGCVGVVLAFVSMTKPVIDALGARWNPAWVRTRLHDAVIELYSLILAWGLVWWAWAAGPGFHGPIDWFNATVATFLAVTAAWGIYGKVRGPIPQTPTSSYLARVLQVAGRPPDGPTSHPE